MGAGPAALYHRWPLLEVLCARAKPHGRGWDELARRLRTSESQLRAWRCGQRRPQWRAFELICRQARLTTEQAKVLWLGIHVVKGSNTRIEDADGCRVCCTALLDYLASRLPSPAIWGLRGEWYAHQGLGRPGAVGGCPEPVEPIIGVDMASGPDKSVAVLVQPAGPIAEGRIDPLSESDLAELLPALVSPPDAVVALEPDPIPHDESSALFEVLGAPWRPPTIP